MMATVKRLVRSSVSLSCLAYMADDWRYGRRLKSGRLDTVSGTAHAGLPLDQSLAYIERVYSGYLAYAGVERIGGIVAEIGPGDNSGVALMLLGNGADEVHAIDRYRSRRDPDQQRRIYRALSERHGLDALFDGDPDEENIRGLIHHVGQPAEILFRENSLTFDAILSRAVLEHLYDPLQALDGMLAALRPGGIMVHRIDLRDHGMFKDHPPLTFLTIPDGIHRRMTHYSGRPNRVLLADYRRWLERSGADGKLTISHVACVEGDIEPPVEWNRIDPEWRRRGLDSVAAVRPRLASRFRRETDEDLAVAGCVLVVRKPTAEAP